MLLFALAAIWITWPLATNWTSTLPWGCEIEPTVPLLNLWTQWWNVDRMREGLVDYWRAPIFHPAADAFAYSEPQLASGIGAWCLSSVLPTSAAVYNALLWGHLTLNGWCTCRMLRSWRWKGMAAPVVGLLVEWMPAIHWQLGVVQLVPIWGAILTVDYSMRAARRPRLAPFALAGLFAAVNYLLCSYYGLMLAILLCGSLPILARRRLRSARVLGYGATAAVIAGMVAGPVIWQQWRTAKRSPVVPSRELLDQLSASPLHFLRTPWPQWSPIPGIAPATTADPCSFSPGTGKLLLALLGAGWGWHRSRQRFQVRFWLVLAGLSSLLAMGPRASIGSLGPHDLLVHLCPGYSQLRNIHRFATFTQWSLLMLAGIGIQNLIRTVVPSRSTTWSRNGLVRTFFALVLIACVLGESLPESPRCRELPSPPAWVEFLHLQRDSEEVLMVYPLPTDNSLAECRRSTLLMVWQMRHRHRMVNGYSGYVPGEILDREERLGVFPAPMAWREFDRLGVTLVVAPKAWIAPAEREAGRHLPTGTVRRVYEDGDVAILRLTRKRDLGRSPRGQVPSQAGSGQRS